ncbi:melatonin receptor type 1A-like [Lytechinus pictus]|uniref:melatonin receptor type 1A-like n=1 Tax=Lytechinus pictus TaxID=7653 RepID=UPI0030B9D130
MDSYYNSTLPPDVTIIGQVFGDDGDDDNNEEVIGSSYSIPLLVAYVTFALFGCIGNILVIGAVFVHHKLRVLSNTFLVNLAVADLSVSAVINGFGILGLINVRFFEDKPALCEIIGIVCVTSCCGSLWSLASIAINRYIAICHRDIYRRIYTRRTMPLHLILIWTVCFLADIPNLFGMGDHEFDPVLLVCTFDYRESYNYNIFLFILAFCLPMVFISFSYVKIFIYAKGISRELRNLQIDKDNEKSNKKHYKIRVTDRRLLRTIMMLVIFFSLMWAPFSLIVVIDRDTTFPPLVYILVASLSHTNSSINWLLYCATNKNFREGYRTFICKICLCGMVKTKKNFSIDMGKIMFNRRTNNESMSRDMSRTGGQRTTEDQL